ncbi:MAG: DUF1592 domain-containing protein [Planctomycetaceae bacterium]
MPNHPPTHTLVAITCQTCGFDFKVDRRFAGKVGACPNPECSGRFCVPAKRNPSSKRRGRTIGNPSPRLRFLAAIGAASVVCVAVIAGAVALRAGNGRSPADESRTGDGGKVGPAPLSPQQKAERRRDRRATSMKQFRTHVAPVLQKYCYECHGPKEQMEGVAFHKLTDERSVFGGRKLWEKVHRVVKAGAMPPADHTLRPSDAQRRRVAKWIEESIFAIDCRLVDDPGRVTIRRLNRSEYNNTIRDLVGVDFNPAKDFPSDDVGYGFDNIGDVLSLPPLLMEKYLDAAEQVVRKAIVPDDPAKKRQRVDAAKLKANGGARPVAGAGFRPIISTGEVYATFHFPKTGDYRLRAEAAADQAGKELAKMEFRLDGKAVKVFKVTGRRRPKVYEFKLKVKQGNRKFAAAFINDFYNPKAPRRNRDRNLGVRFLEVRGPIGSRVADRSPVHKRLLFAQPGPKKTVKQAATEVLAKFLPRAFRRPVTADEVARYVRLVEFAVQQGEGFEGGMQVALQGVLVSPHFLFRIESDRDPNDPGKKRPLNDYELATRLSYFLWSSMPDDELFAMAKTGTLHRPAVLERQVRRMLKDPRTKSLVDNFGSQWLNLRILDEVTPDRKRFPTFDARLRADMRRETELFFAAVIREDRSILDFLDARFTYLNEWLAKHYGIAGVKGDTFRRVKLTGNRRAGVFTHAGILTITSNPTRTSPVKRGKWILENIFDQKPPDPPPGVPKLDEKKITAGTLSLRKQLEIHRRNPVCASCHTTMDAIGFGLENFDAVGRWREKDGSVPVDASGELPGGARFSGPLELVNVLKRRKADFARCFARKLLTFALGRGLEYYDKCAVDAIAGAAAKRNYRFTEFVMQVVKSDPFLMRRGESE